MLFNNITLTIVLTLFCALSFFGYGLSCLFSKKMTTEFVRYGIPQYRTLTGVLQVLAAVGLLSGWLIPSLAATAAAGLALQMACGLCVRIYIKDAWYCCLPAAGYLVICTWLALRLF